MCFDDNKMVLKLTAFLTPLNPDSLSDRVGVFCKMSVSTRPVQRTLSQVTHFLI